MSRCAGRIRVIHSAGRGDLSDSDDVIKGSMQELTIGRFDKRK
jgi:hypothetical protein